MCHGIAGCPACEKQLRYLIQYGILAVGFEMIKRLVIRNDNGTCKYPYTDFFTERNGLVMGMILICRYRTDKNFENAKGLRYRRHYSLEEKS